jgi:hypothetical protein
MFVGGMLIAIGVMLRQMTNRQPGHLRLGGIA